VAEELVSAADELAPPPDELTTTPDELSPPADELTAAEELPCPLEELARKKDELNGEPVPEEEDPSGSCKPPCRHVQEDPAPVTARSTSTTFCVHWKRMRHPVQVGRAL